MKKKIISISLILTLLLCFFSINNDVTLKETSAIHRELESGTIIILDKEVPLEGTLGDTTLCKELFMKINEYRISAGVNALSWNNELAAAAEVRAEEATILWSHTRPNGLDYYTVNPNIVYGENLARGYDTADSTLQAWKDSPTHNDNLLYPDYKFVALAEYNGVITAEFCY